MLRYNFCIIISLRSQDPFFFFDKAQDSCVRVVSQVFMNQLSRSSCSIDNPYNISHMKSCCIVCRICGTLPLRLICFRSFQQNIALRVLLLILLLVFLLESYIFWFLALSDGVPSICLSYSFPLLQDNALQALWSNGQGERKLIKLVPMHLYITIKLLGSKRIDLWYCFLYLFNQPVTTPIYILL
jgi:hypothetical protein